MKIRQLIESSVDNINYSYKSSSTLPDNFPQEISGYFSCQSGQLTSLKGCPISVKRSFDCSNNKLISLDGCPKHVGTSFNCCSNQLTSLEGCPSIIYEDFMCNNNELTSLKYCPKTIHGTFTCAYNNLTSLEFSPNEINGDYSCDNNRLTSLQDIHKRIKFIDGGFYCSDNPIKSHILGLMMIEINGVIDTQLGNGHDIDEVLNKWKNQGRKGVMGAMKELTDLGYEELAQL